jgi:hypothetical protein
MLYIICIGKSLIRAIFWYFKFSYLSISFDVIPEANLETSSASGHSATDLLHSAKADAGLGSILVT